MITESLPLRTESPSIIEWTSSQQSEDYTAQLACRQQQGPLMRMVGSLSIFPEANRFTFRVVHTNPVVRFNRVILPIGSLRPCQRAILCVKWARLVSIPCQLSIFRQSIVQGEPGADFGHYPRPVHQADARYRCDGLKNSQQTSCHGCLIGLPDYPFQASNGVQMNDRAELSGFTFLETQTKGCLGPSGQTLSYIVRDFQRRSADVSNCLCHRGPGRIGQSIGEHGVRTCCEVRPKMSEKKGGSGSLETTRPPPCETASADRKR